LHGISNFDVFCLRIYKIDNLAQFIIDKRRLMAGEWGNWFGNGGKTETFIYGFFDLV